MMDIRNYALLGSLDTAVITFDILEDAKRDRRPVRMKVHHPQGPGPYPCVIVSHGAGGDVNTHFAHARHLATHGYIVVCVEHRGSNSDVLRKSFRKLRALEDMTHDRREVFARPEDVSFALDVVARWNRNHPVLQRRFDLEKVGMLGHSFGAATTLMLCGARVATKWLLPKVSSDGELGPSVREKRIRCGVALSPQGPGEPFFSETSYDSMQTPVLGISGTNDQVQNGLPPKSRLDAFSLWPKGEHQFVWLENARHIDFTDATGSGSQMLPSPTRAAVQPVLLAATLIFLNQHLRPSADNGDRLSVSSLRRYLTGEIDSVSVLSNPAPAKSKSLPTNRPSPLQ
jgi:predicted dienelactone hydrolase